ncbi:glutamyl-trna synthetase [Lasallia pustulata]|uniref:Glutamate--tRNA ligase, mitochondrial n=1 Tax=Lasallia pustulata TaxID=136370 RepID=A0A1W5D5C6_9LECA|nr:glutamyl-trna synthetase [Lasallia pustulata]
MLPVVRIRLRHAGWTCSSCRAFSTSRPKSIQKQPAVAPFRKPSQKLPTSPARTRFAPSPTGYLHLGSLRTALYNYLLAKATGGQFLLRIEDTDQKRTVKDAERRLCRDLEWAGLKWDEGPLIGGPCGPYRQSERTSLYHEHAHVLLRSGHAYRCFCSPDRLYALAKQRNTIGLPTDYDRTCASIPSDESEDRASRGEPHVIRLKAPEVYPGYTDLVYGSLGTAKQNQDSICDPILLKSDGLPTYHLANVVDDHYMRITHVIRAVEWMSSTPKHLAIYDAFGWEAPAFAHVGLLQDNNRQKLSKRKGDIDIATFAQEGIFPEALTNYVALLGWSHSLGDDFLPLQQLIQTFDLKFTKGNAIVNPLKLKWLQRRYAEKYAEEAGDMFESMVDRIVALAQEHKVLEGDTIVGDRNPRSYIAALLRVDSRHYSTPREFFQRNSYFFYPVNREALDQAGMVFPASFLSRISTTDWTVSNIKTAIDDVIATGVASSEGPSAMATQGEGNEMPVGRDLSFTPRRKEVSKAVNQYLRWAVAGGSSGPGIAESMVLLGRDVTLKRLEEAASQSGVPEERRSDHDAVSRRASTT